MVISFQCRECQSVFDSDVGTVDFPPEADRPQFAERPVCPTCGPRGLDQIELTEQGQSQLTELYLNS